MCYMYEVQVLFFESSLLLWNVYKLADSVYSVETYRYTLCMYTDSLGRISGTSDTTFSRLSVCLWQS